MAPEVLENKPYNIKADMYSFGVIFYQILFNGEYPFRARSELELVKEIKSEKLNFKLNHGISDDLQRILRKMLKYNVDERMNWHEIYKEKLFNDEDVFNHHEEMNLLVSMEIRKNKDKNILFYQ